VIGEKKRKKEDQTAKNTIAAERNERKKKIRNCFGHRLGLCRGKKEREALEIAGIEKRLEKNQSTKPDTSCLTLAG